MTTPAAIEGIQVGNAETTLYAVPDTQGLRVIIKKLVFRNTSVAAVSITVHLVPKSGTAGASNEVWGATLQASEQQEAYEAENQDLERGAILSAIASAATSVTARGTVTILS